MPYPLAGQLAAAANVAPTAWAAMTLLNSWSNTGGGVVTAQWRYLPLTNQVEIIGNIAHASVTGSSQIATLTSNLPATQQNMDVTGFTCTAAYANAASPPKLVITTAGALILQGLPAGTTQADFSDCWSCDA